MQHETLQNILTARRCIFQLSFSKILLEKVEINKCETVHNYPVAGSFYPAEGQMEMT